MSKWELLNTPPSVADEINDLYGTEDAAPVEQQEVVKTEGENIDLVEALKVEKIEQDITVEDLYSEEEETEQEDEEEQEVKPETKVEKSKTPAPAKVKEEPKVNNDLLKTAAEYIADKAGFDLPDGIENIDAESFPELLDTIVDTKVSERYAELKSSNQVSEAILEILENGGDETSIVDLFKEQKRFTSIDASTPEGKLSKVVAYYKEIDKKSEAWIKRNVTDRLATSEDDTLLNAEYDEISQLADSHFETERQKEVELSRKQKSDRERILQTQITNFGTKLTTDKNLKKKDVEELVDYVYNDKAWRIPSTGEVMSGFDLAILRAKNDPEILKDVALLLKDKKAYNERIITEANNIKTEQSFKQKFKEPKVTRATEVADKPKNKFSNFLIQ